MPRRRQSSLPAPAQIKNPAQGGVFKFALGVGAPCGIFTDVKILRAGPRGFCLARKVYPFLCAQTKTSLRPSTPDVHQAVGVLRAIYKKPRYKAGLFIYLRSAGYEECALFYIGKVEKWVFFTIQNCFYISCCVPVKCVKLFIFLLHFLLHFGKLFNGSG